MPRECGASSSRKRWFLTEASVVTGSSACADDDSGALGSRSDFRNLEGRAGKKLLDLNFALNQSLLMGILGQGLDFGHVLRDAVFPEVPPHHRHRLGGFGFQP